MRERAIIHLNVADFAVAVERVLDPRLKSRPLIISPQGAARAMVYDMSEEAYQNGVRKGMALQRACRCCPQAVLLPPHPERYEQAMTRFLQHVHPYSPQIEMTDVNGHFFVDVTGSGRLFGPAPDVAWRIRKQVRADLGFDPIWSVAPNKLVAKVATRLVKPNGEYIVCAGEEAAFLAPLPLGLLPGVEPGDLQRFAEFNLTCIRHVSGLSLPQLDILVGSRSPALFNAVRGIDPSPVYPAARKPPAASAGHTFANDTNCVQTLEAALYRLIEQAGADLRQKGLAARRLRIALDYSDGGRAFRQAKITPPSANDLRLFEIARPALERAWQRRTRIRRLHLVCDRLTYPPAQYELFPQASAQSDLGEKLLEAVDAIRRRFGHKAICMGRTLIPAPGC